MLEYLVTVVRSGLPTTLQVTGLAVVLGTVLMVVGGIATQSERRWVRWVTVVYVEIFRGLAALILLFIFYYSLPQLLGIRLGALTAAVLALGTNMGAYGTEIMRGAINAVPRGQTEASIAINLTRVQRYRYVIIPQAVITVLPPYGNLIIEVLKASALVFTIGMVDIIRVGQIERSLPFGETSTVVFGSALLVYFAVSLAITGVVRVAERFASRGREVGSLRVATK